MRLRRERRPDLPVGPGERLLARAVTDDGRVVGGTRDAVYVPQRIPWEQVEAADWDRDSSTLRISEVGTWGSERPVHRFVLESPGLLLQLVRERVTASVVLQRGVVVRGGRGLRVVARKPPGDPAAEIAWFYEYDEGIDPSDPEVERLAAEALETAQADLGLR